jgi:hypothetical protein
MIAPNAIGYENLGEPTNCANNIAPQARFARSSSLSASTALCCFGNLSIVVLLEIVAAFAIPRASDAV